MMNKKIALLSLASLLMIGPMSASATEKNTGQVMAATALLKHTPKPSDEQISAAMINLCRCGTYNAIHDAVHALAKQEDVV